MDTTVIEGLGVDGEPRHYVFKLVDSLKALELMHSPGFASITTLVSGALEELKKKNKAGVMSHVQLLVESIEWEHAQDLFKALLPASVVKIGETNNAINEAGICDYAPGDIFEQYTALCYAMKANFSNYIDFLEAALDATDSSTEGAEQVETPQQ